MAWTRRLMAVVMVSSLFACGATAVGDETVEELKQGQDELRAEIKSVREDLQKILRELAAIKSQGAAAAKPTRNRRQPDTTVYDINIGDSPVRGPKDAPVTIVEFSDFQCPFCVREYPKIKQIMDEYPNDVRFVYKHFPLSFHKNASPAAAAAELARKKGGDEAFWKMHDWILANPKSISPEGLRKHCEEEGIDMAEFDAVIADQSKINALIKDDKSEAAKCKVRGTPTVLINGLKMASRNLPDYKSRVEEILKKKGK